VQVCLQPVQFLFGAVADNTLGMDKIQTEQLHEGVGLDLIELIPDVDGEITGNRNGYKFPNVLNAA
jgi:hypothetical protein